MWLSLILTATAAAGCPFNCSGTGTCVEGACACHPGWTGIGCEETIPCPSDCHHNGAPRNFPGEPHKMPAL